MSELAFLIVTIIAMAFAAVMGAIAWRMARQDRRRSAARIAMLAAEIQASPALTPARYAEAGARAESPRRYPAAAPSHPRVDDLPLRDSPRGTAPAPSFAASTETTGARSVAVVALGVFVLAAIAAAAIFISGPSVRSRPALRVAPAGATPIALADPPLELIALGHERAGNELTVHGVVRNPASGAAISQLTVVVSVFNHDGAFTTSGRTSLGQAALGPGAESTFAVAVPGVEDIGRYRVSFRTGDRVIPHVDRRGHEEMARDK
jgi:hypothetical protein